LNTYLYVFGNALSFLDPKGLSASSEALRQAISKTVGGIAGKKCADSISCDFYKRALPYQLDSVINDRAGPTKLGRAMSGRTAPV
jgi:hypothetical protein